MFFLAYPALCICWEETLLTQGRRTGIIGGFKAKPQITGMVSLQKLTVKHLVLICVQCGTREPYIN